MQQIRQHVRETFKIPVRLQIQKKEISGYTHDISSGGLLIFSNAILRSGTPMALQFSFGDICYLNISGQVVFCHQTGNNGSPTYTTGIKFSAIRAFEQKILTSAVQELKQITAMQEKSLLSINVSMDDLVSELADFSIRTQESRGSEHAVLPGTSGREDIHESNTDISRKNEKINSIMAKVGSYNRIKDLRLQGLYLWARPMMTASGPRVIVNGREMIMLASTNYLGLTTHPKVKEAVMDSIERFGVGAGGVRLLGGTHEIHEKLEAKLASFKGGEACIVYNSGYATNLGTISALLGRHDLVILDKKAHASIFDGSNLSKCRVKTFHHNDPEDLERVLKLCGKNSSKLIIVDSVYSMDGDIADLPMIYMLAKEHNAVIMIDEAHATGVLGKSGRGAAEHFGLEGKIDIIMGTLSKALGGIGGFIVAERELIDYLKHNARPFIFSEGLPPIICQALLAALDVIESEPELIAQLWINTSYMKKGLQELGYDIGNSLTPIIPVIIGDEMKTHYLAKRLNELGVFVSTVAWPAVDRTSSRLRVSVMATHSRDDISEALEAFEKAGKELELINPCKVGK